MKNFVQRDANYLILRHFNIGSQILRFLADKIPDIAIRSHPLHPNTIEDLRVGDIGRAICAVEFGNFVQSQLVRIVVPNRLTSSRLPHALIAWCIARGLRRIYANRTAEPLIIERSESEDLEQISLGSNREGSQYLIKERGCRH